MKFLTLENYRKSTASQKILKFGHMVDWIFPNLCTKFQLKIISLAQKKGLMLAQKNDVWSCRKGICEISSLGGCCLSALVGQQCVPWGCPPRPCKPMLGMYGRRAMLGMGNHGTPSAVSGDRRRVAGMGGARWLPENFFFF